MTQRYPPPYTIDITVYGLPISVAYSATSYTPAYTAGPPEHCHPAEGGDIEILGYFIGGIEVEYPADVFTDCFLEATEKTLKQQLEEPAQESAFS